MSFDLGVWFPHRHISSRQAGSLYEKLCKGDASGLQAHPAVDAFYAELTAKYPDGESVPEEKRDDIDYSPWSCALDKSDAYITMSCVGSKAEDVEKFVNKLADKHGLAVYNPQSGRITYPESMMEWRLDCECDTNLPLPPGSSFAETFEALNPKSNSFYVLEHGKNYIQCGGSHRLCTVELREYQPEGKFRHYVFYHAAGLDEPIRVPMSAGGVIRQKKHGLTSKTAITLFECFYTGQPWPKGFALEDITHEFT